MYPCGIKQKISEFALHLRKTDAFVSLVTAGSRSYYVYRYEGKLNGIENAVVLISYSKEEFHAPKALRAFISTDVSLSTEEILDRYMECGDPMPFEDGYAFIYNRIQKERIHYICQCGARKVAFGDVLALVA